MCIQLVHILLIFSDMNSFKFLVVPSLNLKASVFNHTSLPLLGKNSLPQSEPWRKHISFLCLQDLFSLIAVFLFI